MLSAPAVWRAIAAGSRRGADGPTHHPLLRRVRSGKAEVARTPRAQGAAPALLPDTPLPPRRGVAHRGRDARTSKHIASLSGALDTTPPGSAPTHAPHPPAAGGDGAVDVHLMQRRCRETSSARRECPTPASRKARDVARVGPAARPRQHVPPGASYTAPHRRPLLLPLHMRMSGALQGREGWASPASVRRGRGAAAPGISPRLTARRERLPYGCECKRYVLPGRRGVGQRWRTGNARKVRRAGYEVESEECYHGRYE
ncbi:hypothetical protein C8R46DRAFT_438953 [Mycena filopes]|nr:hypothetical protein C8R46DRAFT_438953 [Mycena filopes]